MLVIEHLQGKQGLIEWLRRREEEAAAAYREVTVTVVPGQARALMRPAGPRGGELPR